MWSSTAILSKKIGDIDVGEGWLATIWTDYAIVEFVHMGEDEIIDMINSRSWEGRQEDMTWPVLLVNCQCCRWRGGNSTDFPIVPSILLVVS